MSQKTKFLIPDFLFLASAKSTSRPTKSTRAEVGRPARSTNVHGRAHIDLADSRSTDPVDRPESSALWKGPGRLGGRPDRESALCIWPRSTDRWHNGLKYDRWPVDRAVDRQV